MDNVVSYIAIIVGFLGLLVTLTNCVKPIKEQENRITKLECGQIRLDEKIDDLKISLEKGILELKEMIKEK